MLVETFDNIDMSQNSSTSNGNGASFAEPFGNRVLSMSEVETLRRMTVQNSQQQQNNNGGQQQQQQPQSNLPTNPFLVLAQVPVQATQFANFTNAQQQPGNQSSSSANNSNPNCGIVQQNQPSMQDEDAWANFLQPTPLAPNHHQFHNANNNGMPSQQQQQRQPSSTYQNQAQLLHGMSQQQQAMRQQQQQQPPQAPSDNITAKNNSNNNSMGNNNNIPFNNPSTMSFLQQLMMNAASAALQQQQQMMQQQQNNNNSNNNSSNNHNHSNNSHNTMNQQQASQMMGNTSTNNNNNNMPTATTGMGHPAFAGAPRMAVGSFVTPVSRPESNQQQQQASTTNGGGGGGVQAWKQMWDPASKTMFQQQHQILHQAATGQGQQQQQQQQQDTNKFMNNTNGASVQMQPAKRKFADLQGNSNDNSRSSNFNQTISFGGSSGSNKDDDDDDDLFDIAPTPLSEIRKREQELALLQQQQQQPESMAPAPSAPQPSMPGVASQQQQDQQQWQNWTNGQMQQMQQQLQQSMQMQQQQAKKQVEAPKQARKSTGGQRQQAFILPSTMMPPTVLASTFTEQQAKNTTNKKRRAGAKSARSESPHAALGRIVQERGYQSKMGITSEEAGYDAVPSPLQLASFGTEVVKAVHTSDAKRLGELLSAGLSPNPCNQFRDSIVDLVCKRANDEIFQCLVDHGSELRVCDGFGRTPLHHCCWASEFCPEIADAILKRDLLQLFIEDKRGQTPLEYVRPNLADAWVEFLEEHKEEYFPVGGTIPMLINVKEVRPDGSLPNPPNSLSVPLAGAVSSGQVTPEEVSQMDDETKANYEQ